MLKNVIDIYRGYAIKYSDFISIYPYVKKYNVILYFLYLLSKVKGQYKNANPNNYVYFYKKVIDTISDPREYLNNLDINNINITLSRNLYNYLEKYDIINNNIIKYESIIP